MEIYNEYNGILYVEPFRIGDIVTVITGEYYYMNRGTETRILDVSQGTYSHSDPHTGNHVYYMKIKVSNGNNGRWYVAKKFKMKIEGPNHNMANNKLQIGVDKPCIIFQTEEIVNDAGVKVNNRVGEPIFVESYSAAQALTQKKIQEHIRIDNIYDTYVIFEQKSIAKAKEPPVVFEND